MHAEAVCLLADTCFKYPLEIVHTHKYPLFLPIPFSPTPNIIPNTDVGRLLGNYYRILVCDNIICYWFEAGLAF
jgi:hypothetical protein